MKKRIALLLIVLLTLPIVYSAVSFVIQETEKISLKPEASDLDNDQLQWVYSDPLDENGEWQTTYGDAGEYKATVSVTDGQGIDTKQISITVRKKEEAPTIDIYTPDQGEVLIKETQSIDFDILAYDLNKDPLEYKWFVDGKEAADRQQFTFRTDYKSAGRHEVLVEVSDEDSHTFQKWAILVENIDVEGMLEGIEDAKVNENEIANLMLPDFEKYGLTYTISEPLGNDNSWKTTYDDAGTYDMEVYAKGNGFEGKKDVKLIVNNVDLPPQFEEIDPVVVSEGQKIRIDLKAKDYDNDDVEFYADNLPKGAELNNDVFTWTPGYDTVTKDGFGSWVMEKLSSLSNTYYIKFTAQSNDHKVIQNSIITVKNTNRAPELDEIKPIKIKEGQSFTMDPRANDPDGDKIAFEFSGLTATNTYTAGFDDAGTHKLIVTATDGQFSTSEEVDVVIEDVNRAPEFQNIPNKKVSEGQSLVLMLGAIDPDGDQLEYSIDNAPKGSFIKGDTFFWSPDYDVLKSDSRNMELVFVATDGEFERRQVASLAVENKNRPPKVIEATVTKNAKVGKPVLMSIKAQDEDGDDISYNWEFNILEDYDAGSSMKRVFTSSGTKDIKVTLSDGKDEVVHYIRVNVS